MNDFTAWKSWKLRNELPDLKYPGIYSIAYSKDDLSGRSFDWIEDIIYIGMTNSKGGLKQRLQQFENTILGRVGHGGAERVKYKYNNYPNLVSMLYVSVTIFNCDVSSNKVEDLQIMGKVAEYEYVCFAEYVKRFNRLPEFNDKERSPKQNRLTSRSS